MTDYRLDPEGALREARRHMNKTLRAWKALRGDYEKEAKAWEALASARTSWRATHAVALHKRKGSEG